jgi:hypothetical protein
MPTRQEFIAAYSDELKNIHSWARDASQLNEFLIEVERVLNVSTGIAKSRWNYTGKAALRAWRKLGQGNRITLLKLRALTV